MRNIYFIILAALLLSGCTKSSFLDERPRTSLIVPSTLVDMQAILDNEQLFVVSPVLGELSSNDYYMSTVAWNSLSMPKERNAYIWQKDIYDGVGNVFDWNVPYQQILYCNLVLESLNNIPVTTSNDAEWKRIKGSAHFLRAYAYHQLAQIFCPAYDSSTFNSDLGLPLKTSSDINLLLPRANVKETYELILDDLKTSCALLPPNFAGPLRNRPTRPAAFAQMARVFLSMRSYRQARNYADSSLQLYNTLINYNTVSATATLPFSNLNNEALYQSAIAQLYTNNVIKGLVAVNTIIDSTLFRSYDQNDLRRVLYFTQNSSGNMILRPGYYGGTSAFSGLATDEVYLIRAECAARAGDHVDAMADLNRLLQNRYRTGTFTPLQTNSPATALNWILTERRKELCFRGIRWSDLKRLNKEGANIILTRIINGTTYTLNPNSPLYVLPIPADELNQSGIQQNNR